MTQSRALLPASLFTLIVAGGVVAGGCGDSTPESQVGQGASPSPSGGGENSGGSNGTPGSGGSLILDGTGGTNGAADGGSTSNPGEGCAESDANADLAPVYLAFLLDQSLSMTQGQAEQQRWVPVTEALSAFFADPQSAGLLGSLTLFPSTASQNRCDAQTYVTPDVPLTDLPSPVFEQAMADAPADIPSTPTFAGLSGVITFADGLLTEDPTRKVAIVMVTDGIPQTCNAAENSIEGTAAAAMAVADRIPTYVVGVGPQLDDLNAIAVAGGTGQAFLVAVGNPQATRDELLATILQIRGNEISCEMPIPAPPNNQQLDPNKVNVEFTSGGVTTELALNETCADGQGWHYDNPDSPTRIVLCPGTCDVVKAAPDAELRVVFGCVSRIK